METPLHTSEFADVFRGQCNGQEVAVKVLRVVANDLEQIRKVGRPQLFACVTE